MASLSSARLKNLFLPLIVVFLALVAVVLGGAFWYGEATASVTITPLAKPVTANLILQVTAETAPQTTETLPATVTEERITQEVTAIPPAEGALVDARAGGTMKIINETSRPQPLTAGTRFKADNGVIVRSNDRIDVPANGQATVQVTADPLGIEGNLPAGKFIIVALWPGTQSKIYGTTDTALTGGQARQGSTLDVATLTKASNEAEQQIREKVGQSTPGTLRLFEPDQVKTNPKSDQPSDKYQVTVTMVVRTIKYNADTLNQSVRAELNKKLESGLELFSVAPLELTRQPGSDLALKITGQGTGAISSSSLSLQPDKVVNLTREALTSKLLNTQLIKDVTVTISPSWQKTLPSQADRIKIIIRDPAT